MKTEHVPQALREVWEWKDSIYQEVKHLPTEQALQQIMENAARTAKELGFHSSKPAKRRLAVAEKRETYGVSTVKAGSKR